MSRLLLNVEGETEEGFVNSVLAPHLYEIGYTNVGARLIGNSRARSKRGGIRSWSETKSDILRHLNSSPTLIVGLMVDFYALPIDWPNKAVARALPYSDKAKSIEAAIQTEISAQMGNGFNAARFAPHIMMHEFEALLFSNCRSFASAIDLDIENQLQEILDQFGDPERINDFSRNGAFQTYSQNYSSISKASPWQDNCQRDRLNRNTK